jgi:integrase
MSKTTKNIDDEELNKGFDRDLDYKIIKKLFIKEYKKVRQEIDELDESVKNYITQRRNKIHKLIYLLICMIQLRNGSRISEACAAFRKFVTNQDLNKRVIVKIAKSETLKTNKKGEEYTTPRRNREMIFPSKWVEFDLLEDMKFHTQYIEEDRLRKRVLDYLLINFNCNTHSLRYAFINYMLYELKRPMNDVAKFVGHSNPNMLVKYTQLKNSNQIFDLDI